MLSLILPIAALLLLTLLLSLSGIDDADGVDVVNADVAVVGVDYVVRCWC